MKHITNFFDVSGRNRGILKGIFILAILLTFNATNGWGQTIKEDFASGTIGNSITASPISWSSNGTGNGTFILNNSSSISYPNYNGGGGNYISVTKSTSGTSNVGKIVTSISSGNNTFYTAFLINISQINSSADYFAAYTTTINSGTYNGRIYIKSTTGGYLLGISKYTGTPSYGTTILNTGTTYLIITKYTYSSTSSTDDAMYLWINPSLTSEPSTSSGYEARDISTTDATLISSSFGFTLKNNTNTGNYTFDGLKVAYASSSSSAWTALAANATYSIIYNANNATSGTPPSDTNSPYSSGATVTVLGNTGELAKTGYIFSGWNTTANSDGTSYSPGATFSMPATNTTLYAQWKSTDATLSSLNLSAGTLSPTFASGTTSYSTTVGNATSAITVTPTVNESHATITVNGTAVSSGTASGTIALAEGANTINVVVTAQDGTTQKTYSITVTRQAANSPELTASSISDFGNVCINTIPSPNSFNISASNLTSYITIGALNGFSYATEINGSYSSTLDLAPSSGNINQTIYVQFLPTAAQSYSGDITITGGGLSGTINLSVVAIGINSAPTVTTTSSASSVSSTSATLSGTLTDTGCQTVIAKGFCYGTTTNPDLSGSFTTETGTLSSTINNLSPNTTYHFRAYATSAAGTSYGNDASFTTSGLIAPTATIATQVSATGFTASWNAIGGATGYYLDIATTSNFTAITSPREDNFESNSLSNWSNTGNFLVSNSIPISGTYSLRVNAPASQTTSYITTQPAEYNITTGTTIWRFSFKTGFSPSSNNKAFFVLMSNQQNLLTANGYIVGFNFSGTDDLIKLWRSTNGVADQTIISSTQAVTSGTIYSIEINRTNDGIWTLKYKSGGGFISMTTAGTGTETTYTNTTYSGLVCFTSSSNNTNLRFDDLSITHEESSITNSYNNTFVPVNSQTVTGLSPNTAYYYRVRATGGNNTSANSNVVTAITGLTTSATTSALPDCPTCNIVINNGGTLTVNSNKTFGSVSADPGANITINNGNTLTAPVTLQSNSSSTATLVDNNTSSAITATVQQYLSGKTGTNSRGWWYVASPVSNATAAVFIPNGSSNKFGYWDEATGTYPQITDNSTSLNRGQGYVFYNPGNDAIVNFSGTLNTGDVTIYPTRTGTTNGSRGFNLVGNPYPSYLDWEGATKTHIRNTIWYRTMGGSAMTFDTYDNSTGTPIKTGVGVYGTVSNFIPPMQAFWVKVDADGLALNEASVVFHNADRSHQDQSSTNNHLRAPSENTQQPSIVRLRVSNGLNRDEAILVANNITSDDTDSYDVPKMPVNNTEVPELFSLAGQEELVINYQNNFADGKEIQLGFRPGKATDFSIQAAEFSNADNNLNVILKDNGTEYDLTNGEAYNFSADATPTNTRFSIVFRAAGAVTSAATQSFNKINTYCNQAKQLIIQLPAELSTASASICNAVGQTIRTTTLQAGKNTLSNMSDGVYLIKVRVNGQAVTRKVVVK